MTLVVGDRVHETSTTTGTGTYDLAGPESGMQDFVAAIGDGNQTYYVVSEGTSWEVGVGTVTSAVPDTLSRDKIIASSNSGSPVDWSAGTRDVIGTVAGEAFMNKCLAKTASFTITEYTSGIQYECSSASAIVTATLPDSTYVGPGFEVIIYCDEASDYRTSVVPFGYPTGDELEGDITSSIYIYPGQTMRFRMASTGDNWIIVADSRSEKRSLSPSSRGMCRSALDTDGYPYLNVAGFNIESGSANRSTTPSYFTSSSTESLFECWLQDLSTIRFKNKNSVTVSYSYQVSRTGITPTSVVSGTLVQNDTVDITIYAGTMVTMQVIDANGANGIRLEFVTSVSTNWANCVWFSNI